MTYGLLAIASNCFRFGPRGSGFFRNPDAAMIPVLRKLADLEIETLGPVSRWISTINSDGQTIWFVEAHGYGKRSVVRSDEM